MLIPVKFFGKYQIWSQFSKISTLVKIFRNHDLGKIFINSLDFAQIFNNLEVFFQNSKEKYIDFLFKIYEKSWFKPKYSKISTFVKILVIISIFVIILIIFYLIKSFGNLDFVRNFRKLTIFLKIFEKS